MGKTIKVKERWEVTYENFKNGKMPKKVETLTEELKAITKSRETLNAELEKAKNELEHAKSSEEYRNAEVNVKKKEAEIKDTERAIQAKQEQIDEEKNKIEKNKDKIENIIALKKMLVDKTAEVLEQIENANKIEAEKKKIEQKIKDLDKEREEKASKVREIEKKLKESGISKEDEEKLKAEKATLLKDINANEQKYSETLNKKKEMDDAPASKPSLEDLKKAALRNEQLIGKCDLIGASLIKGNDVDEISTKLSNFKFSPNPKFAEKIKLARQNRKEEKTNLLDRIFDELIAEERETTPTVGETAERTTVPTAGETAERTTVPVSEIEETEVAETLESESAETDKPAKIGWFARRFPKMAAAGHWIAEKFNKIFRRNRAEIDDSGLDGEEVESEEESRQPSEKPVEEPKQPLEKPVEETQQQTQNNKNADYDYIIRKIEKMGQDEVLTKITSEGAVGFKASLRSEAAKRYAESKAQTANHYAETYKGNYYRQDGATVKPDDSREPDDE